MILYCRKMTFSITFLTFSILAYSAKAQQESRAEIAAYDYAVGYVFFYFLLPVLILIFFCLFMYNCWCERSQESSNGYQNIPSSRV